MVALDEQFHHKGTKTRSRCCTTSISPGFQNRPLLIDHCSLIFERSADAYGNTLIFTGPGPDGLWFTDDDVQSDYGANEIVYCGYRYDPETALYYVRNRYYSPALGRWLTRDPIGYLDGSSLYQYVESGPTTAFDPGATSKVSAAQGTGRCFCGPEITGWLDAEILDFQRWIRKLQPFIRKWARAGTPWYLPDYFRWKSYEYAFLIVIGVGLDYFPKTTFAVSGCSTGGCKNTVTLGGECIHTSAIGNIIFGSIALEFHTTWAQTVAGEWAANDLHAPTAGNRVAVALGYDFAARGGPFGTFLAANKDKLSEVGTNAPAGCHPCKKAVVPGLHHVKLPPIGPNLNKQNFNMIIPRIV